MSPEAVAFRPAPLPTAPSDAAAGVAASARAAGYAAGWAAGARAAAEQADALRTRLTAEADRVEAHRHTRAAAALDALDRAARAAASRTAPVLADAQRAVLDAALELAAAVLQRELAPGPDGARAVLERALAVPADLDVHTVRLCPADLAHVQDLLAAGGLATPDGVRLVADARLRPGDAISEHPTGYLDARISTALDRARRALLEDLG